MAKKLETLTKEQLIAKLRDAEEMNKWYADFHEYCFNNGNSVASLATEYADDQEKAREYKI